MAHSGIWNQASHYFNAVGTRNTAFLQDVEKGEVENVADVGIGVARNVRDACQRVSGNDVPLRLVVYWR
jgi:hypothetical protein